MDTKFIYNSDPHSQYKAVFLNKGQAYLQIPPCWQALQNEPPGLMDIVIAFHQLVFGLDAQGYIWRWEGSKWEKDRDAKNVVSLSGDDIGLWCANKDGQVYLKTDPRADSLWTKVDEHIPEQAGEPAIWEYLVKSGDCLWSIVCNQYGTWYDPAKTNLIIGEIRSLNPSIGSGELLQIGMKLKMPPKAS